MAEPPRRFAYYNRLSAESKRTYRRSDAIGEVPLHHAATLAPLAITLREALASGESAAVQTAASRLVRALLVDLDASPVDVEVLEARPRGGYGELHGLYTWDDGERPRIQVWTRTAARGRVVAWKTFLRTLLHEVGHHLDIHWLDLAETFHTRGFYRRENHLFDQLQAVAGGPSGEVPVRQDVKVDVPAQAQAPREPRQKAAGRQLKIPGF